MRRSEAYTHTAVPTGSGTHHRPILPAPHAMMHRLQHFLFPRCPFRSRGKHCLRDVCQFNLMQELPSRAIPDGWFLPTKARYNPWTYEGSVLKSAPLSTVLRAARLRRIRVVLSACTDDEMGVRAMSGREDPPTARAMRLIHQTNSQYSASPDISASKLRLLFKHPDRPVEYGELWTILDLRRPFVPVI